MNYNEDYFNKLINQIEYLKNRLKNGEIYITGGLNCSNQLVFEEVSIDRHIKHFEFNINIEYDEIVEE